MIEVTSFDALACELNLSSRMRDLNRIFFRAGLEIGRGEKGKAFEVLAREHVLSAASRATALAFYEFGIRKGAQQAETVRKKFG